HLALLANNDLGASHVARDLAVHLQRAPGDDLEWPLADDLEVVADDGLARPAGLRAAELRWRALSAWTGFRSRLERIERWLGRRVTREHGHGYPPEHCLG